MLLFSYTPIEIFIYIYVYIMNIKVMRMSKLVSLADDVYNALSKRKKDDMSFSEVIRTMIKKDESNEVTKFFGILRDQKDDLEAIKAQIALERKMNKGRKYDLL